MNGIRPCVIALILATAIIMLLGNVLGLSTVGESLSVDFRAVAIFAMLIGTSVFAKKVIKKKVSPIIMIALSAFLGVIFYGLVKF